MGLVEDRVPVGQELVAKSDGFSNGSCFVCVKEPGFSPASVQMCMCSHEWVESSSLLRIGGRGREREGGREGGV